MGKAENRLAATIAAYNDGLWYGFNAFSRRWFVGPYADLYDSGCINIRNEGTV